MAKIVYKRGFLRVFRTKIIYYCPIFDIIKSNQPHRTAFRNFPRGKHFEFESHLSKYDTYIIFKQHLLRKRDLKVYGIASSCCIIFCTGTKRFQTGVGFTVYYFNKAQPNKLP